MNNTNKIIYHDISFRSGKKLNNKSLIKKKFIHLKLQILQKNPKIVIQKSIFYQIKKKDTKNISKVILNSIQNMLIFLEMNIKLKL